MKAVKIRMKDSDSSKAFKALIVSVAVNAVTTALCMLFLCLIMTMSGALFDGILKYLILVPLAVGGYAGGFCAGRINKSKGMLLGGVSGAIALLALIIISFCIQNTEITYILILKVITIILFSAIGGVKGINKKEKFRI